MQAVKSFIIGIAVLCLFFCLFCFFIPSHVSLARRVEIPVAKDSLRVFLGDLRAWPRWCTWMGSDSVVDRSYTDVAPGQDASVTWFPLRQPSARNSITIAQTTTDNIRLQYQFGQLLPATGGFTLTPNGPGSTFLEWRLELTLRWYPWEKISGIAMDKVWGGSMTESLTKLKTLLGGD